MSASLTFVARESTGPLDTPLGVRLRACERRIGENEAASVEARWEFGRELLRARRGKQLPKGLAAALMSEHGLSRSEVTYRMQFAELCTTQDEVVTAVTTYGSWTQIRRDALPKKPRKPASTRPRFKQWRKQLMATAASDLDDDALRELVQLRDIIDALCEETTRS